MRKVIQIQAVGHAIVALCDDGTMWQMAGSIKGEWLQLSTIPQEPMLRRESDKEFFASSLGENGAKVLKPVATCNCGKVPGNCCIYGSACGD